MEFADAFGQIRGELGAQSREKKSTATLGPEEQLANWRSQMTPEEHDSLLPANVKGKACQNLLEGAAAKDLAIEERMSRYWRPQHPRYRCLETMGSPGHGEVLALAEVHSLWCLYEHLSGVSPQWRS